MERLSDDVRRRSARMHCGLSWQTSDFYRILGLLRSARQPVPMRRLIEELGVTRNTITRDFEYLRDFFGAPIVYDRDCNGHYYDPEAFAAA